MPEGDWVLVGAREEYISKEGIIGYRGNNARGKKWRNHMSALEIRDKVGYPIWSKYFKFCVIRNPFDKLISGFFFLTKEKMENKDLITNFRRWIKSGGAIIDSDKYLINKDICIDYFIRHEELENGIEHVCNLLHIPFEHERLPKLKSGIRDSKIPIRDFYNEETIQIVSAKYKFELEYFNYSVPE